MTSSAKAVLRQEMRQALGNLSPNWIEQVSLQINQRLLDLFALLPIYPSHVLGWSPAFPGEINLDSLFEALSSKTICYLPRVEQDLSLNFISTSPGSKSFSTSALGIPEPEIGSGVVYSAEAALVPATVVLVPGLAFTAAGARIGRGKGCYDRFLSRPELQGVTKIGVCFASQFVAYVPIEDNDISMDWICCEQRAVKCSG